MLVINHRKNVISKIAESRNNGEKDHVRFVICASEINNHIKVKYRSSMQTCSFALLVFFPYGSPSCSSGVYV